LPRPPFERQATPCTHTGQAFEAPIIRGLLELLERIGMQLLRDFSRKGRPDPGNGLEKLLWLKSA
jgi:hypothetical protein